MEAVFVNPHQEKSSSPLKALDAFFTEYTIPGVQDRLLRVYRFAVMGGLTEDGKPMSAEEVASLFDQLVSVLQAADVLRQRKGGARYSNLRLINRRRRRAGHE